MRGVREARRARDTHTHTQSPLHRISHARLERLGHAPDTAQAASVLMGSRAAWSPSQIDGRGSASRSPWSSEGVKGGGGGGATSLHTSSLFGPPFFFLFWCECVEWSHLLGGTPLLLLLLPSAVSAAVACRCCGCGGARAQLCRYCLLRRQVGSEFESRGGSLWFSAL